MRTKRKAPEPPTSMIETFRDVRGYTLDRMVDTEPFCFNGMVGVKRYRVTVEEIPETKEVLEARFRKLWEDSRNHHDFQPLQAAAKALGVELEHAAFGAWRPRKLT